MSKHLKLFPTFLLIAGLFVPAFAHALTVNCDVTVNYTNGTTSESYQKNFTVGLGPKVTFFDDFSTALRQKEFSASSKG